MGDLHRGRPATDRRAALVAGASAGIGLAIARALVEDRYAVTIAARHSERLAKAAAQLREAGGEVNPVRANVALEGDINQLVDEHERFFGRTDVLISNAGGGQPSPIESQTTKTLDLQLDLNLRAAYLLLQRCIPMLTRAGRDHGKALVVNIGSLTGRVPQAGAAAYSAAKAGLIALSQSAHGELSPSGVQVTVLCPGFVETPGIEWAEWVDKQTMMLPEDVAEAVRFLLRTSTRCAVPEIVMSSQATDLSHIVIPAS